MIQVIGLVPTTLQRDEKMSLLDIKCHEAVGSAENCSITYANKNYLLLGGIFQIYLSFQLPPYPYIKHLKQARLILYKISSYCNAAQTNDCPHYSIFPLLDYFSACNCAFIPPAVDCSREEIFTDKKCCCYTEADVTRIVKSWIDEKIENKGFLLTGGLETRLITYASDIYKIQGMRPVLRLIYEENGICPPMSVAPCTVEVN